MGAATGGAGDAGSPGESGRQRASAEQGSPPAGEDAADPGEAMSHGRMQEVRRVARLLRIIGWVGAAPHRWTRRALAEHLGVSERQIDNDLLIIRHGLCYEMGHNRGGYAFTRVPELPPVQYTPGQALTLLTALHLARGNGAIDGDDLAAALARTEAALPEGMAELVSELRRLGDIASPEQRHRAEVLRLMQRAWMERRAVRVVYESASSGTQGERVLRIYHLQPNAPSWVLIAHDSRRDAVRIFRVDRILSAEPLDERYSIPESFDLEGYWGEGWGILRDLSGPPREIVLRLTAEEARRLRDDEHHPSQQEEQQPDGSWIVTFRAGINPELVRWVFRWGTGCTVLAPAELRALVAEQARAIAAGHDGPAGGIDVGG